MAIDFDLEIVEMTGKLKQAAGYLNCERIIVHNVNKQIDNGMADENIIQCQKKPATWVNKKNEDAQGKTGCTNYRYAAAFGDTLLKMTYWKSRMKTNDM